MNKSTILAQILEIGTNNSGEYIITVSNTLSDTAVENAALYRVLGVASGSASHAEGQSTRAIGENSHSEGNFSTASGPASHAEGQYTIAATEAQHAQGKYNIEDTTGIYAHIVGNGRTQNNRSNAHTVDWFGNAWYSGDVYVGSTSGKDKDEGSKKLATEEYVDEKVASGGGSVDVQSIVDQVVATLGLPTPTTADAGKFLRVNAEGKYGLVALPNAEEATF